MVQRSQKSGIYLIVKISDNAEYSKNSEKQFIGFYMGDEERGML